MQHYEIETPLALKDVIKCFWYTRKDLGAQQTDFEVLPDGYAEIIFYFGSACSLQSSKGLQTLPSPFMIGLLDQPAHFHAQGLLEVIGVRCYPWTVFDLLGLPPGKDGVRVFQHPIARLQSPLADLVSSGKIEEALALLQSHFLNSVSQSTVNELLAKAGAAMSQTNGTMPVGQVASSAHSSVRTLERQFKQSSGYTVKDVAGLMRFEQVRNRLLLFPATALAALAQELGYADQAHLSREFKRYSGNTPAAFARKAKKEQQFVDHDFVVFIQD